ncbi:hypothetical protein [Hymenobacter setariae]|nr:hypothetical protein [Hymenobacter setariae]
MGEEQLRGAAAEEDIAQHTHWQGEERAAAPFYQLAHLVKLKSGP